MYKESDRETANMDIMHVHLYLLLVTFGSEEGPSVTTRSGGCALLYVLRDRYIYT